MSKLTVNCPFFQFLQAAVNLRCDGMNKKDAEGTLPVGIRTAGAHASRKKLKFVFCNSASAAFTGSVNGATMNRPKPNPSGTS